MKTVKKVERGRKGGDSEAERYTYRVIWSEEDQEHLGLCAEFPSLSWLSPSADAAWKGIRKVVADAVTDLRANGEPIPEPLGQRRYSGKLIVRIPPDLHRRLAVEAEEAHVSLNRLISAKLAS
jgi:predicted HicB family RNase H-like nuclease